MIKSQSLAGAFALFLVAQPSTAQDLSFVTKIFSSVHSVNLSRHYGTLLGETRGLTTGGTLGLRGNGIEVMFDVTPLTANRPVHFELGLGVSTLSGFRSSVDSLDLRGSFRANPHLSLNTWFDHGNSHPVLERLVPYVGIQGGVVETVNLRGYDTDRQQYSLDARTLEIGGGAGLYAAMKGGFGIFVEGNMFHRKFASIDYKLKPNDAAVVPVGWPLDLRAHSWGLTTGIQFRIKDDSPNLAGGWIAGALEGQSLPATYTSATATTSDGTRLVRTEVVGGALDLNVQPANPNRQQTIGGKTVRIRQDSTFTLTLLARKSTVNEDGKTVLAVDRAASPLVAAEGSFSIDGNQLILRTDKTPPRKFAGTPCRSTPMAYAEGWISSSEIRLELCDTRRTVVFKRPS